MDWRPRPPPTHLVLAAGLVGKHAGVRLELRLGGGHAATVAGDHLIDRSCMDRWRQWGASGGWARKTEVLDPSDPAGRYGMYLFHLLRGNVGERNGRAALVHDGAEVLHHGDEAACWEGGTAYGSVWSDWQT